MGRLLKTRHRTRPIAATRAQTVRQSLHSGQVRAHTRTNRKVLLLLRVHVLLLLLLIVLLVLLLARPRVSLMQLLVLLLLM